MPAHVCLASIALAVVVAASAPWVVGRLASFWDPGLRARTRRIVARRPPDP